MSFIAIINPDTGPEDYQDSNYVRGVKEMQAAGIIVLGYVDTTYASDDISSVEANARLYDNWYDVDGIMSDDMSNTTSDESYYATSNSYVKSLGMNFTMETPGVTIPKSEVGVFNLLDIYESSGTPASSACQTTARILRQILYSWRTMFRRLIPHCCRTSRAR